MADRIGELEAQIHRLIYAGDQFLAFSRTDFGEAAPLWEQTLEKWGKTRAAAEAALFHNQR